MHKNTLLVLGITILFLGTCITPIVAINNLKKSSIPIANGNTLYVGGTGPGNYTKIQDAVDDAVDGDTVYVYDDSSPYYENILIDKSINLIGEDKDTTEIISDWEEYFVFVINISSDFVNISGFTIKSDRFTPYGFVGISIASCNNKISDNIITAGFDNKGIELSNSSNNNIIMGNIFLDSAKGIYSSLSSNNIIKNNYFTGHWDCIVLDWSEGNIIINNTLNDNEHGITLYKSCNNTLLGNRLYNDAKCTTFYLYSSNNNTIKNNTLYWVYGFYIRHSHNNTITGNTISYCHYGIHLWNTSYNKILCNSFISSKYYGISYYTYFNEYSKNLRHSKCYYDQNSKNHIINANILNFEPGNNIFYHNNFLKNGENAFDNSNNIWDDNYPSGGNYWDDYTGYDYNGDGIGDIPYDIPGGDNKDRYPLMEPWGNINPYVPRNYYPCGETVDIDVNLSWDGGDPNPEDTVTYDVYLGSNFPLPKVATVGPYPANQTRIEYDPGTLLFSTKYYWIIVAWDNHGSTTIGPICYFQTIPENHPPDTPVIEGKRRFKEGEGGSYPYSIYSTDPDGHELIYLINWSDGDEEWIGPFPSGEKIIINVTIPLEKGSYILFKVKAIDIYGAESDWAILEVIVPRNKATINSLLMRFLEQFPLLERLLILI